MTFRDFMTGCWLSCIIIVLVGISYLHAAGKLHWMPFAVMVALAVRIPLAGFAVGLVIDRRFRDGDGN